MTDKRVHLAHCYQGEYAGSCKYGDSDCPAAGKVSVGGGKTGLEKAKSLLGSLGENDLSTQNSLARLFALEFGPRLIAVAEAAAGSRDECHGSCISWRNPDDDCDCGYVERSCALELLDKVPVFIVPPLEVPKRSGQRMRLKRDKSYVVADPLWHRGVHESWGVDCPHCSNYEYESLDIGLLTIEDRPRTCGMCDRDFYIIYPFEQSEFLEPVPGGEV